MTVTIIQLQKWINSTFRLKPFSILLIGFLSMGIPDPSKAQNRPEPPTLSVESGYYSDPFELVLQSNDENASIYFTLDGSVPSPENPGVRTYQLRTQEEGEMETRTVETFLYEDPILIVDRTPMPNGISAIPPRYTNFNPPLQSVDKITVIRAVAVSDGIESEVTSATYLVGDHFDQYRQLPILSIMVDEEDLWGYERGIYVLGATNGNFFQRGREWERPIHIEFIDENGEVGFSQKAGIRIHGGTSRAHLNKSFRVYARSDYGKNTIEYPLFPNRGEQVHKRLKLRTAGQDKFFTYFRDPLMTRLMLGTAVTAEDYRPAHLFLNGEYWGITNIRERFDNHYAERNFGIPREEVHILDGTADEHYSEYLNFISTMDPADDNYYTGIRQWIDLNSFLDLKIAEIFFGRWDMHWEHWRDGTDPESRWKWVMWDFDVGMVLPGYVPTRRAEWSGSGDHTAETDYLTPFLSDYRTGNRRGDFNYEFSTIVENREVRNHFLNRLALMINSNLSNHRMLHEIEQIQQLLEPIMPLHIERWAATFSIGSMQRWWDQIEIIREFSSERPQHVMQHAIQFFDLPGTAELSLDWDENQGTVIIEDVSVTHLMEQSAASRNRGSWSATLFRDIPVRIKATSREGYRFKGWAGLPDLTDEEILIELNEDLVLQPLFEPIEEPSEEENEEVESSTFHLYPNPFSGSITLRYHLEEVGSVRIQVFNLLGQRVAFYPSQHQTAGTHIKSIDFSSHSSGLYYLQLTAPGKKRFTAIQHIR